MTPEAFAHVTQNLNASATVPGPKEKVGKKRRSQGSEQSPGDTGGKSGLGRRMWCARSTLDAGGRLAEKISKLEKQLTRALPPKSNSTSSS